MRIFGPWSDLFSNTVYWNGIRTTDTNPQAYFAALKMWSVFAGRSEFSLEWFSLSGGAVFVALCIALARRTFGRRAAMIAALFGALSPLAAWYAVELRMYSWVVALSAVGVLLLLRFIDRPSIARFAAWLIAAGVSLATHYSFVGMITAHFVVVVLVAMRVRRLRATHWAAIVAVSGIVLAALAILLDAPALWARFRGGAEYSYEFRPLGDVVGAMASGVLFGVNQTDPSNGWLSWLFVAVCAASVAYAAAENRVRTGVFVLALSVAAPILVWYALSLVKPNFSGVRHLMLTLSPLLVVMAGAIDRALRRTRAAVVLAAVIMTANGYGMSGVLLPGENKQDDWRSAARTIRTEWRPDDLVIANSGTPREVVEGYLGDLPVAVISVVGIDLAEVARARRIWYLNTGAADVTPEGVNIDWLRTFDLLQSYRFAGRTNTIELLLMTHDAALDEIPSEAIAAAAEANNSPDDHIAAWQILPTNAYAHAANLQLRLFWRRGSGVSGERVLSVRLRHEGGTFVDVALPGRLPLRSEQWSTGRLFAVDYALPLPLGLPPLPYDIEIVSFDARSGRLQQSVKAPLGADHAACCVRYASWQPQRGPSASDEVIRYLPPDAAPTISGLAIDDALASVDYADQALPGSTLFIGVSWKERDGAWRQGATLQTLSGRVVAETPAQDPVPGLAPQAWPAGELVRTTIAAMIPEDVVGGWHRLTTWREIDGKRVRAYVGLVQIVDYPMTPPEWPGEIGTPINGIVGDFSLLGVSVDGELRPGQVITASTFWRVDAVPVRDGVIFVHMFGPDGKLVAQEDHPPDDGARSTRTFRVGAGHREYSALTMPAALAPGKYTLYVGIYDRDDFERWPAQRDGVAVQDDLIAVREFSVNP